MNFRFTYLTIEILLNQLVKKFGANIFQHLAVILSAAAVAALRYRFMNLVPETFDLVLRIFSILCDNLPKSFVSNFVNNY
jgi:hypothetical protein